MVSAFFKELFRTGPYKTEQGKTSRRLTFLGLVIVFLSGAYCAWNDNVCSSFGGLQASAICAILIIVLGSWFAYRLVNFPPFADFLVSVEAEMRKVSWPSRRELFVTTRVVMIFMVMFVAMIYFYDTVFNFLFSAINYLVGGGV